MKSYLSLIPLSAKTRRKQNRLILICIILAVFLVTSVFSYAEIITKGQEQAMIRKHGNYHIILNGISEETAEEIARQENMTSVSWYRAVGEKDYENYKTNDTRVILYGTEQSYIQDIRNYEYEGFYPQNDNEVMLSANAKESLGVHLGEGVTIDTPDGGFTYRVSGFCIDEMMLEDEKFDGVCAYVTVNALAQMCGGGESPVCYVRFKEKTDLKEAIADVKTRYALSDADVSENIITVGMSGASSRADINHLYILAAAVFVMILTAGVLMISSCMNSNISQRTKFFGMMRCIGASRKQIMRFVRLEALNWCKSAIPIGCGLGVALTWVLCIALKNLVGGEFNDYTFRFSIIGIVCGALVGVVTVLIAAHSPAKRAAGVSPVEAVSGNARTTKQGFHSADTRMLRAFKVESALGVYHAVSAKKNLILMTLSFAFTITLFLTFFAGIDFVKKLLPSESNFNPDISIAAADNGNSINKNLKSEMSVLPGVDAVFGCAFAFDTPAEINGEARGVDLMSYDDYMFDWSKKSVVSGDITKITADSDYAMTIYSQDSRLDVGDKIKIGDTQLEIVCVVSEGVGNENHPSVVCTEETFSRITGDEDYVLLNVQLEKDASEETVDTLRMLAGENEFADRREDNQTLHSSFWVFRIAAYGFLGIIALIMVFNIMNSISMSVSARMKQYGAMRAVGMDARQLTKMIAAEAVTYAALGLCIGIVAGLYLHRLLTIRLILSHFGGVWKVPMDALGIVSLLVVSSCAIAVYAPAKRMRQMAVVETVSEVG
ncbi:MAG: ABC transporter permease [Bacillus sp. (in: Bacteria)]|nr:ABC transporter permease [Bacillus sp. (in: firmicutes)]MCM1426208.1 ABC transporter permease [Eubacterium sp.]